MKKRGENKNRGIYMIFLVLIVLLLISGVSADIFDWFKKTITGKASSQPTNLTITVSGTNPAVIEYVSSISATNPIEATNKTFVFYVTMSDANGVADLNDTSVSANFSRTGQTTRNSSECTLIGDIDATKANYSCKINMWYWDEGGGWNITVKGKDLGNQTWVYNTSTWFTYNQLKALVISPVSLTWSAISPSATNQTSDNDPVTINNTGNYDGAIDVTAVNLLGNSDSSYAIFAENFTIGLTTGAGNPECAGTAMVNATLTAVSGSDANPNNLSLGGGVGQEQFYYCLFEAPSALSSQTYSTTGGGSWTVSY